MVVGILALIVAVGAFPVRVSETPTNPVLNASRFTLPSLAAAIPTAGAQSLTAGPVPLTVLAPSVESDILAVTNNTTKETRDALAAAQTAGASAQGQTDNTANEKIPIFFEYEVKAGDTLGAIASRFSVGVDHIRWNNVDVVDSDAIYPGLILAIPSVPGIIHSVRDGETVTEIAEKYDADWRDIVEFRANNLSGDPNNILPGTQILVPGGRIVPLVQAPPARPGSDAPSATGWQWPVLGLLTSPYGPSHPLGIDIAAPVGTPIYAANSGIVSFAGGNPCCSYGFHIILDHGDGYETLYAHLSDFAVVSGQYVNAGDVIGYIGMTGRTTGPHVHFEIKRNGTYQNPMGYLP
jgi:murein DD-endopeptidase MepM/ murein hydrolase activator NlpD